MIPVFMPPSSRPRTAPRRPLLSHHRLLVAEAVLLIGLAQMAGKDWLLSQTDLPAPLRVALGMALTLGLFGGLLLVAQRQVQRSLRTTHRVVQRLPIPTPVLGVHALAFLALFGGYARYWNLDSEVLRDLHTGAAEAGAAIHGAASRAP
jgi:hypothetical protein